MITELKPDDRRDAEIKIREVVEHNVVEQINTILHFMIDGQVPSTRALLLLSECVSGTRSVLGQLSDPDGGFLESRPNIIGYADANAPLRRRRAGQMPLAPDAMDLRDLIAAQRLQALSGTLDNARKIGHADLAAWAERELRLALPPDVVAEQPLDVAAGEPPREQPSELADTAHKGMRVSHVCTDADFNECEG